MSNQFHRLLTESELHRPERTGRGDPNELTRLVDEESFEIPEDLRDSVSSSDFIFNPEDGQYYQDLNTGDIYRYVKYESVFLTGNQTYLIGDVDETISADENVSSILISNQNASVSTPVVFSEGQILSLQTINGDFQKLVSLEDVVMNTQSQRINVKEFTARFDIGGANAASILGINGDGKWEKIISYDRTNQTISNVAFKQQSTSIGTVTKAFGGEEIITRSIPETRIYRDVINDTLHDEFLDAVASTGLPVQVAVSSGAVEGITVPAREEREVLQREVTSVTVNLNAQVLEGQEITILNEETGDFIFLTLETEPGARTRKYGPGEDIILDVQDDRTGKVFPVGSLVFSQAGFIESTFKVDPARIQQSVKTARSEDSIGVVDEEIFKDPINSLTITRIKEVVDLKDEQKLALVNDDGFNLDVVVDGAQTLEKTPPPTLDIQELNPMLVAPAIATIDENLVSGVQTIEVSVTSAINGIELRQDQVINLVNENGEYREVAVLQDTAIDENTTAITIKEIGGGPVIFGAGDTEFLSGTSFFKFDPPRFDRGEFTLKEPSYVSTSRINVTENQIVLKVDTNGRIATVALIGDADNQGSVISIAADQINISGQTNFASGYDPSTKETPSGAQSKVNAARNALASNLGYSDYADMVAEATAGRTVIDGGLIRTSLIEVDNLFAQNALISGSLTVGTDTDTGAEGSIQSDGFETGVQGFQINADGSAEFQEITIGGGGSTVGGGALLGNLSITGTLGLIDPGKLEATNGNNSVTIDANGITGSDNFLGTTFTLPTNGDAPTFSSGVINETTFEISTNAVLRTSTNALAGAGGDAGVLINNAGIYAGEAGQEAGINGDANVRINADGTAFFSGGIAVGSGSIGGPTEVTELKDAFGQTAKYGDVNLNGVINGDDAIAALSAFVNPGSIRGSYQTYIGDINGNGILTAADAADILSGSGKTGEPAIDTNNPFYTNCQLGFNTGGNFISGTGVNRSGGTETFFRIAPFNSFINVLRTDFTSSAYIFAESLRASQIIGYPTFNIETTSVNSSSQVVNGRVNVLSSVRINNESDRNGNPVTVPLEAFALDVIGDTRLRGELRFDGITTSTSASAGTNGDVPSQVVGYIKVNVDGTDYKIPYYS